MSKNNLVDDLDIALLLLQERFKSNLGADAVYVVCDRHNTKVMHQHERELHEGLKGSEAFPKIRLKYWDKTIVVLADARFDITVMFLPLAMPGAPESPEDLKYIGFLDQVHDINDEMFPPDRPELRPVKFDLAKYEAPERPKMKSSPKLFRDNLDWYRKFDKKRF